MRWSRTQIVHGWASTRHAPLTACQLGDTAISTFLSGPVRAGFSSGPVTESKQTCHFLYMIWHWSLEGLWTGFNSSYEFYFDSLRKLWWDWSIKHLTKETCLRRWLCLYVLRLSQTRTTETGQLIWLLGGTHAPDNYLVQTGRIHWFIYMYHLNDWGAS